jgi:CRISPR/Cas system-associated exonuclease Cas4 (RecB family)
MKSKLLVLSSLALLATNSFAYEVTESERDFINKYREAKLKEAMKPKVTVKREVMVPQQRQVVMPKGPVLIKNAQGVHVPYNVHRGQPMQQRGMHGQPNPMMQQQRRVQAPQQVQRARPIQMPMPRKIAKSDVNYDINKIFAEDFPVTYRKKTCKNCSY